MEGCLCGEVAITATTDAVGVGGRLSCCQLAWELPCGNLDTPQKGSHISHLGKGYGRRVVVAVAVVSGRAL